MIQLFKLKLPPIVIYHRYLMGSNILIAKLRKKVNYKRNSSSYYGPFTGWIGPYQRYVNASATNLKASINITSQF